MRMNLEGVYRIEECRRNFFAALEEELLKEYKCRGYSIHRWDESRGSSRGAGTGSRAFFYRYHLLAAGKNAPGVQFTLAEEQRRSGSKISFFWNLEVEVASKKTVAVYASLRYILPLAGAAAGYAAWSVFAEDGNWPWWVLAGGFAGFILYGIIMRLFWKTYKKTGLKKNEDLSDESLNDLKHKAVHLVSQIIEAHKEKDVLYSYEAVEEAGYTGIDFNNPEDLAVLTMEQADDMEGTLRKYGIPVAGPRRDEYTAAMVRLRDDREFYQQYLDAYNRQKG